MCEQVETAIALPFLWQLSTEQAEEVCHLLLFAQENLTLNNTHSLHVMRWANNEGFRLTVYSDGKFVAVCEYNKEAERFEFLSDCSECETDLRCTEPGITICQRCALISQQQYEETVEGNWKLAVTGT